jgi:hypothetical protein
MQGKTRGQDAFRVAGGREEARELAGACDGRRLPTAAHADVHAVERLLRTPRDLEDVRGQLLLATA